MKKAPSYRILCTLLLAIFVVVQFTSCVRRNKEDFEGAWIVPSGDQVYLLTFSNDLSGKGYTRSYYIRLIDPETGKIISKRTIEVRSGKYVELKCKTSGSIWVEKNDDWLCLEFPSLKTRWNKKKFFAMLKERHPEVGEPFNMHLNAGAMEIVNTTGKKFVFSPMEFESKASFMRPQDQIPFVFFDQFQVGKLMRYKTPEDRFKPVPEIIMEVETDNEGHTHYYYPPMNIYEKLQVDEGYAKYYAVFFRDSSCYYFDGEHSRTMKKLVNDSAQLVWDNVFRGTEWLDGDFLRPFKGYKDLPEDRCVIGNKTNGFIHYHTSLDPKENKNRLMCVDMKTEKKIWDVELSFLESIADWRPEQNFIFKDILITIWINAGHEAYITGINVNTGEVKWKIDK